MTYRFPTEPSARLDAVAYMKRQWGKFEGHRDDDELVHPKRLVSFNAEVGYRDAAESKALAAKVAKRYKKRIADLQAELAAERKRNALLAIRQTETWQDTQLHGELKWRDSEIQDLRWQVADLKRKLRNAEIIVAKQGVSQRLWAIAAAARNIDRVLSSWWREDELQKAYDLLHKELHREEK